MQRYELTREMQKKNSFFFSFTSENTFGRLSILAFSRSLLLFLKKNAYLCRQNEAGVLFHMVSHGTVCRFPGSRNELAGTGSRARTAPPGAHRIDGHVATATASPRSHADRCHTAVSHLLVTPTVHPAHPRVKERADAAAGLQQRQATLCQTTPFLFRQQMPFGVGTLLPVSLERVLRHRPEAYHSLARRPTLQGHTTTFIHINLSLKQSTARS